MLQEYGGVNTTRFLKHVWQFFDIMHERVKRKVTFTKSVANLLISSYCVLLTQGLLKINALNC